MDPQMDWVTLMNVAACFGCSFIPVLSIKE